MWSIAILQLENQDSATGEGRATRKDEQELYMFSYCDLEEFWTYENYVKHKLKRYYCIKNAKEIG